MRGSNKMKQLAIILAVFLVAAFIFWAWPKSHALTISEYFVGHYRGFGIPGFENPVFGKRYYLITINFPGEGNLKVKYRGPGYNDFKRFYPDGTLAEEGQCLVEHCDSPEPEPDYHNLLWSKCYKPDGTLCSEVTNGIGTQVYWSPDGVKTWELELVDFKRVRHSMWYPNGQLSIIHDYTDDLVDGPFISYYPSGAKKTEGAYSRGDRVGKWKRYNEDGSISKIEDYNLPP